MDLNELIQTVPLFASFSQAELTALEKMFSVAEYDDGHYFTREGKPHNAMFLVVSGEVLVKKKRPSQPGYDVLKKLAPGDLFGFVSLIDHGPATASCQAAGKVLVAYAPYEVFQLLLHKHASIARHFQEVLAEQLSHAVHAEKKYLGDLISSRDTQQIRAFLESADRAGSDE